MSKIAIIGGGISGLVAGVYARKNGFECEIYEKHTIVGGECTGWDRQGFHIDNCVHWMTGTSPDKELYKVWKDVGVLGDDVEVIKQDKFFTVEDGDKRLVVWQDINRFEKDLIALAPEDTKEIKKFVRMVRAFFHMEVPAVKPSEQMSFMDNLKLMWKICPVFPYAGKYNKTPITEYIKRFKNPMVRDMLVSYMPETYNTVGTLFMYATFMSGNGYIIRGGSFGIANNIKKKFESLGGVVHTGKKVIGAQIADGKISSLTLNDGETITADYFVFACDAEVTFSILGNQYMPEFFRKRYADSSTYPLFSSFNVYVSVDANEETQPDMVLFRCKPFDVFGKMHEKIVVKNFDYEPSFAPEGKSILQVMILQDEQDYKQWEILHENREVYKQTKLSIAQTIVERIEEHYPSLKGKLVIIETVSPYSYKRFLGAHNGAYMSFISTHKTPRETFNGKIDGLSNVQLTGQWTIPPGGLPNAAVSGKFAIQRIVAER